MPITVAEVEEVASAHLSPGDGKGAGTLGAGSDDVESGRAWLTAAARHGLSAPSWPEDLGGRGATSEECELVADVLSRYAVPDMYPFAVALDLVGPILLEWGTDEQRARWMPAIADGSEIWCQMFSEPAAGSDLANIAARARRDGDEWTVTGQKVWTSRGPYSRWGLCLARTDPEQPKHRGLTMFAVDMESPGVDVRPLHQMNGDRHFSEVFVTDAVVPDADRIGAEGEGWAIAMAVLTHERASLGGSGGGLDPSGGYGWLEQLRTMGALDEPVIADRAMRIYAEQRAAAWVAQLAGAMPDSGPWSGGSGGKLRLVKVFKGRTELMKDALGAAGMLTGEGHVEFLTGPSMSIRGGTDEVQRNIIGERILGLPPEPRVDKGVSYRELREQGLT